MIPFARMVVRHLDLDARDTHFYGGIVLVAVGAALAYLPAGRAGLLGERDAG